MSQTRIDSLVVGRPQVQGRWRERRVALLSGGLSSEREVSQRTADAIARALIERGYDITRVDAGRDLPARLVEIAADVVFVGLHGTYGEDGRLQGLLDWMGLPYTGDGVRASLAAFDKVIAKQLFRSAGVPVAPDRVMDRCDAERLRLADLPFGLPVVVKPAAEGSSVGVSIVRSEAQFADALRDAAQRCEQVLVEGFVEGPELSVAVLGRDVLGSVEVEPARPFYDYAAKYESSGTRYYLPPRLPDDAREAVERVGLAAHMALGCRGLTRVDLFNGHNGPIVLEVNTLPGMTPTSLVPKIAGTRGLGFADLMELVLDHAACGPS